MLQRNITFAADTGKRTEYRLAWIGPQPDAPFDGAELQGADVPVVFVAPGFCRIEGFALTDAVPDRTRPLDPIFVRDIGMDRHGILSGLAKDEDVVRERGPQP